MHFSESGPPMCPPLSARRSLAPSPHCCCPDSSSHPRCQTFHRSRKRQRRNIRTAKRVRRMADSTVPITIYHNPACGTSRNTLALIRNAGIEPTVIEYLKTPPDRTTLESLLARMNMRPRELLREKGTPYAELGLARFRPL